MAAIKPITHIQTRSYQFFQLVELLNSLSDTDLENQLDLAPADEAIRYTGSATLAFPVRDVASVDLTASDKYQVQVAFLSLTGAGSPLPSYYLESLSWEEIQQDKRLAVFLDLFNHRLVTILHRLWRKYRYYISFQDAGEDRFSQRMFALVGLGDSQIRDSLQVNRSKMLSYAGILASSGRSPQILASLIAHSFELSDVNIRSWQFRWVPISPKQQNRIGVQNASLGSTFMLGSSIPDYSGKFVVAINNLTRDELLTFLPNGMNYPLLVNFVSFVLRDRFAWDLDLGLGPQQAETMQLGTDTGCLLGWTTFIGNPPENPNVLITVQE